MFQANSQIMRNGDLCKTYKQYRRLSNDVVKNVILRNLKILMVSKRLIRYFEPLRINPFIIVNSNIILSIF